MLPQVIDLVTREGDVFQILQRLLESGGHEIIAPRRQVPDEQLKRGTGIETGLPIARRHREFVEIGEKA